MDLLLYTPCLTWANFNISRPTRSQYSIASLLYVNSRIQAHLKGLLLCTYLPLSSVDFQGQRFFFHFANKNCKLQLNTSKPARLLEIDILKFIKNLFLEMIILIQKYDCKASSKHSHIHTQSSNYFAEQIYYSIIVIIAC